MLPDASAELARRISIEFAALHEFVPGPKRHLAAPNNNVASLIGHSGSSAFRLSTTIVSMSLTGSCFSSESAPRPLYGAFLVKRFK